jgi:hypothetical protein
MGHSKSENFGFLKYEMIFTNKNKKMEGNVTIVVCVRRSFRIFVWKLSKHLVIMTEHWIFKNSD